MKMHPYSDFVNFRDLTEGFSMKKAIHSMTAAVAFATLLAACGGGGDGDQSTRVTYTQMVSFGDSLSDVGSYGVSTIKTLGGGQYTVNGITTTPNWTERIAKQLNLPAPCAAQTGLKSIVPQIPAAPVTNVANCFGYAQGGARVTDPIGPGNAAVGDAASALGLLTDPVARQIQRHLAVSGGQFNADALVTVLAGGNEVFTQLGRIAAGVETPAGGVGKVGQAGAELAGYVKNLILAKGARYVVVVNVPDVSQTPFALSKTAATQQLILSMTSTFNQQLKTSLSGVSGVLWVDAFAQNQDQIANPEPYGLSNVRDKACDLTKMAVPSSVVCTTTTLIAGDTSHYLFADDVHPTPFAYELLARLVLKRMVEAQWL
jgi:outer membrane lipase/esterase